MDKLARDKATSAQQYYKKHHNDFSQPINTLFIGNTRVDEQIDVSDQFGAKIIPGFFPGEIIVSSIVEEDTTEEENESSAEVLPESFSLRQNYPNPFNPSTRITFSVPYSSRVSLAVYDGMGRELELLTDQVYPAGTFSVEWNAGEFPSGIYLYRLETNDWTETRKLILQK